MSDTINDDTPCVAGCRIYSGNERKHHKHCPHYPESFSRRFDELQAELNKLKEEYGEATDTIQDLIDMLKDPKKRLEKSRCPHAIAAGAWLEQALKGQTNE